MRKVRKKRTWTVEEVKSKIKADRLSKRLQLFALGELKAKDGTPIELSPGQIKATEVLLKHAVPTLSAQESRVSLASKPARELTDNELAAIVAGAMPGREVG
jgi:hypothetical protein